MSNNIWYSNQPQFFNNEVIISLYSPHLRTVSPLVCYSWLFEVSAHTFSNSNIELYLIVTSQLWKNLKNTAKKKKLIIQLPNLISMVGKWLWHKGKYMSVHKLKLRLVYGTLSNDKWYPLLECTTTQWLTHSIPSWQIQKDKNGLTKFPGLRGSPWSNG